MENIHPSLPIRKGVAIVLGIILLEALFIYAFAVRKNTTPAQQPIDIPIINSTIHVNKDSIANTDMPETTRSAISSAVENIKNAKVDLGDDISLNNDGQGTLIQTLVYVPVVRFGSLIETTNLNEIKDAYANGTSEKFNHVYIINDTKPLNTVLKVSSSKAKTIASTDSLINKMTKSDLAIIPFEELNPKLSALKIDKLSILDKELSNDKWPLTLKVYVDGKNGQLLVDALGDSLVDNRVPQKIGTLVMTGVTAISRGVEYAIERHNDPIYPARGVMDVLSKADLTHVNSENPLFDGCVPEKHGVVLCGKTRSIANFKAIGVDIVGLTGNHRNDYGPDKNLESIGHLEDLGLEYYGGGKNEKDAGKILYKKIDDITLAFVGYAYFDSLNGPSYRSLAYGDRPGANYYSAEKVKRDIETAHQKADFVIVEYQFTENYSYNPIPGQIEVFQETVDNGADLVMGVQSHQPQWIRFRKSPDGHEGTIFYGLGNFFFDQMWSLGTRQGIIPEFVFYNGKLVSMDIMTTLLYDYSQPRFVTGASREAILKEILP